MALKFDTSMVKELKLRVRKIWGLIPISVEVTGGPFWTSPILNSVKP